MTFLNRAERDLIRRLFQWARTNGWSPSGEGAPFIAPDRRELDWWSYKAADGTPIVQVLAPAAPAVGRVVASFEATSVALAVDVLSALALLPAEFSSAYRAGVAEGRTEAYRDWPAVGDPVGAR